MHVARLNLQTRSTTAGTSFLLPTTLQPQLIPEFRLRQIKRKMFINEGVGKYMPNLDLCIESSICN